MPGFTGGYFRTSNPFTIPPGQDGGVFASCSDGDLATGGGFTTFGHPGALEVYEAKPIALLDTASQGDAGMTPLPSAYLVWAYNSAAVEADLQAWVICLDVPPGLP